MDARTLDRQITERLGWRVIPVERGTGLRKDHPNYPPERLHSTPTHWIIRAPDGISTTIDEYHYDSEVEAHEALEIHYDYSTSAHLMLQQIADEHLQVRINPQMDGTFFVWIDWSLQEWSAHADTIPAAFWLAWIAYTDTQER